MLKPRITLLTHEREPLKVTNTGRLALELFPSLIEQVIWSRVEPELSLVDRFQGGRAALLYPSDDALPLHEAIDRIDNFVILDATWQQARKMYNQSPYLKSAVKIDLYTKRCSQYQLRRNQIPGGLCTAECIMELFLAQGMVAEHEILELVFQKFNSK